MRLINSKRDREWSIFYDKYMRYATDQALIEKVLVWQKKLVRFSKSNFLRREQKRLPYGVQ